MACQRTRRNEIGVDDGVAGHEILVKRHVADEATVEHQKGSDEREKANGLPVDDELRPQVHEKPCDGEGHRRAKAGKPPLGEPDRRRSQVGEWHQEGEHREDHRRDIDASRRREIAREVQEGVPYHQGCRGGVGVLVERL